jgi:tetratricopeptide (TPR) repeat protein
VAELLDLRIHAVEEFVGKRVIVGGASYLLEGMIAEGGQCYVFPARNRVSRLAIFVVKVCKWLPGSEDYEREARQAEGHFRLAALSTGNVTLHTENHEIPGGLIRFEEALGGAFGKGDDPEDHSPEMDRALGYLKSHAFQQAIEGYDRVLCVNPKHTRAMINKGGALIATGRPHEALRLVGEALQIEPNDRKAYHQAALALVAVGRVHQAIEVLDARLSRCRLDYDTWKLKGQIAASANMADVLGRMVEDLGSILGEGG